MIRVILFLFLSTIPVSAQTIKEQTTRTLMAMTNISATQVVNGVPYRVAMFGNRQVSNRPIKMPHIGLRPGSEWYSLLQNSQLWKLTPNGDHFTYTDSTRWFEIARISLGADDEWEGTVACEGEVYVVENNIVRITQRFNPSRLTKSVSVDMIYEWVPLKEKRLLPVRMTMTAIFKNNQRHTLDVLWTNYEEFGVEMVVKEPSDDEVQRQVNGSDFFELDSTSQIERTDAGLPTPVAEVEVKGDVAAIPSLVSMKQPTKTKTVRVSYWKSLLRKLRKQPH